jgi:hypothetical protein
LLIPAKASSAVGADAGVSGYYVLAKMQSPGIFRLGKLQLQWSQTRLQDSSRDDLSINLEGLIYSGTVSCPSKGTLLQVDLTEGSANVGTSSIGVGAGAAAVRIDWDCSAVKPVQLWLSDSVRTWLSNDFGLLATTSFKINFPKNMGMLLPRALGMNRKVLNPAEELSHLEGALRGFCCSYSVFYVYPFKRGSRGLSEVL